MRGTIPAPERGTPSAAGKCYHGARMRRRVWPELPGEDVAGAARVGALLRQRRERRGWSVEDVGRCIRCGPQRICAVEEGRFDELPPHPYARGLIATYANLVGLDAAALLRACGPDCIPGGGEGKGIFLRPQSERRSWREWTIPIVLAWFVVFYVVARQALVPAPMPLEAPVSPASNPPVAADPTPEAATAMPARTVSVAPEAPGVLVLIRSEGKTWIEAAPDGVDRQRHDLGPGDNLEVGARERLDLVLGDAGAVRLTVNGREIGFIGSKGEMKAGVSFKAPKTPAAGAGARRGGDELPRPEAGD